MRNFKSSAKSFQLPDATPTPTKKTKTMTTTAQIAATYKTEIVLWSAIGNTPITGRKGAYCDELVRTTIECENPARADEAVRDLINSTPHARKGHFFMPTFPNQNTRSRWISL